jgi:hypothetical protein
MHKTALRRYLGAGKQGTIKKKAGTLAGTGLRGFELIVFAKGLSKICGSSSGTIKAKQLFICRKPA